MFGWFKSKKTEQEAEIANLKKRIEELETVDKKIIGQQTGSGDTAYAQINRDDSVIVGTETYLFHSMDKGVAIQLRDFLLKHFPVEEFDVEKPEVSE